MRFWYFVILYIMLSGCCLGEDSNRILVVNKTLHQIKLTKQEEGGLTSYRVDVDGGSEDDLWKKQYYIDVSAGLDDLLINDETVSLRLFSGEGREGKVTVLYFVSK